MIPSLVRLTYRTGCTLAHRGPPPSGTVRVDLEDSRQFLKSVEACVKWLLCALLLLPSACRSPGFATSDGDLRVSLQQISFGEVGLEGTGRRPLELTNAGRAPLTVTMRTLGPFGCDEERTLAGGEAAHVEVTFTPTALGPATGTLVLATSAGERTLLLDGVGVAAPECTSSLCRDAVLDERSLACITTTKADGTTCTDLCLSGTCQAGECVGTTRGCDDGDVCTVDACTPGVGCVYPPRTCGASDACHAAACVPGKGCEETEVPDGTACGEGDCITAQVCIAGACVARPVPEGAACGVETICQKYGRCRSQQCVREPPTLIPRAWSYTPAAGRRLYGLVADPQGNYFTVECWAQADRNACELDSFSRSGAPRWRTPFPGTLSALHGALRHGLMLAGTTAVATVGPHFIHSFNTTSGAIHWWQGSETVPTEPAWFEAVAFDGSNELIVLLDYETHLKNPPSVFKYENLASVFLDSGTIARRPTLTKTGSIVIASDSTVILAHARAIDGSYNSESELQDAITAFVHPSGGASEQPWKAKWRQIQPRFGQDQRAVRAARLGRALTTHPAATNIISATGAVEPLALPITSGEPAIVWGTETLFMMPETCPTPPCSHLRVLAIANDGATKQSSLPDVSWTTAMWLTQRGSVLVTFKPLTGHTEVREVGPVGQVQMSCGLELEPERAPRSVPILSADRYATLTAIDDHPGATRIEVWLLPGYAPADKGWVSPRGGPGLDLRER